MKQSSAGNFKQFGKVLKFELQGYLASKAFIGITIFLVLAAGIGMFVPKIVTLFNPGASDNKSVDASTLPIMLVTNDTPENDKYIREAFASKFHDYNVILTYDTLDTVKEQVMSEHARCAFAVRGLSSYTYYVKKPTVFDQKIAAADEVMKQLYQTSVMAQSGMSSEQMKTVMSPPIQHTTEGLTESSTAQEQAQGMVWASVVNLLILYTVMFYGQMLVMSVVLEKSSRVMEVLITSIKPKNMIFGKVIAACIAILVQLVLVCGTLLLGYYLNKGDWQSNLFVPLLFSAPMHIIVYAMIFFLLGFLLYSFLFGMAGSLIPKIENTNSSVPYTIVYLLLVGSSCFVTWLFFSREFQSIPTMVLSFIPFSAPMVMFVRAALDAAPFYQIMISMGILVVSVLVIGILSAKIYRVGVLLSGTKPKLKTILWAMKETEKRA